MLLGDFVRHVKVGTADRPTLRIGGRQGGRHGSSVRCLRQATDLAVRRDKDSKRTSRLTCRVTWHGHFRRRVCAKRAPNGANYSAIGRLNREV